MVLIPINGGTVTINTGNILSLNDIMKKPGQNPTEELAEALKITLKERKEISAEPSFVDTEKLLITINRDQEDLVNKITLVDRADLKIGIKLFVNSANENNLKEAINQVFTNLNIDSIDNLIVSFNSAKNLSTEEKLCNLKAIWLTLQTFSTKICQFGLSDIEEANFRSIYEWATIKPAIIQINLATCCVVPPSLQQFCKENDIQLLTHSDPSDILPKNLLSEIFAENELKLNWALRFQVHIKCRGVLTTKGYLVNIDQHSNQCYLNTLLC